MSLDDNVEKLKILLARFPEMENPDEFVEELEKRRKVYIEIRDEVEELRKNMEVDWAENAWHYVKNKNLINENK